MKNLTTILLVLFLFIGKAAAQSVGISNEEITPHPAAALEIRTTEKGILIPRMTQIQKNAIAEPTEGLLLYQTDGQPGFYYYDGSAWQLLGQNSQNTDNDADPTNEIQGLSLVGDTLFLSKSGYVILPNSPSGSDNQFLTLSGDTLKISNGNYVLLQTTSGSGWDHNATKNIKLNSFYLSADGDNEGLRLSTNGNAEFSNNLNVEGETTLNNLVVDGDADLGNAAIQNSEIDVAAVTTAKIADNAITSAKIMNAQITAEKLNPMGASTDQFLKYDGSKWTPSSIATGLIYLGTWDASTNTPVISDATGGNGNFYIVSVAGSQNLGTGAISFEEGDWAIHNGSAYEKVNNSNDVNSVFGRTGIVTAQYGDYSWNQINMSNSSLNNISDVSSNPKNAGRLLIADGSEWVSTSVSGDATLNSAGVLQIGTGAISYTNLQNATGANNTILKWSGTKWEEVLFSSLEGDASATNEIQTLGLSGNSLSISSGNAVNLSTFMDNTDDQQLTLIGSSLSIEGGNSVDLSVLTGSSTDDQQLTLTSNVLSIEDGNSVNLSAYLDNTDAQNLSLSGTTLNISGGTGVNLSSLAGTDTDDQTLSLVGNVLSIIDGNSVNLSPFLDNTDNQALSISNDTLYLENSGAVFLGGYENTDNQTLGLVGTNLNISGGNSVDLSSINTDGQTLSINPTNKLIISDGNQVDLTPYLDNTDAQNLTFSGTTLGLTNSATTFDLGVLSDNLGNHTMSQNLELNGNFLSNNGSDNGILIDNQGNVSIGSDIPQYKLHLTKADNSILRIENSNSSVDGLIQLEMNGVVSPSAANDFIQFFDGNNAKIGQIEGNGSSVAYTTTSDIRLKENLVSTHYGLNTILNVKVYDYNYIGSVLSQTGFSAQQLYTVYPVAVSKGGEDPKKNPWAVDYSKLTPVLTKAVQELNEKVTALETENAELKSRLTKLEAMEQRLAEIEAIIANQ